ncbi:hypothetical protein SEA_BRUTONGASTER_159 [Gordonia phage BrutonGaster]|uniref:Uncharacterized protein n=1 Tax=Gordonia phage BrutonGaster TaxID=2530116 RepID=A0A482JKQ4_9CAUD|nr:hypothetical protein HOV26_gp023 [Gordonia phage BrutonGaster]QBP33373.1 hypothetical protein SEA_BRUTONGASTER_159 [Gordonia phage BrutonGaster]
MNPWLHALQFIIITSLFTVVTLVAVVGIAQLNKEI